MSVNAEYDRHWKDWKSGPPPADPRGPHRVGHHDHPVFDSLCDEAVRLGLIVRLGVSDHLVVMQKGFEQRNLRDIRLFAGDEQIMAEPIRGGPLDGAARRLLLELRT